LTLLGGCPVAAFELETAPPIATEQGAHPNPGGWVDFGLHAPAAQTVDLLLYDVPDARIATNTVPMVPPGIGASGSAAPG
jgi:hypothetical protein